MCSWCSIYPQSDAAAIIIFFTCHSILSIITISSLYDQYGCRSFCTSCGSLMAIHTVHMIASLGTHHLWLLTYILLLSCSLVCVYMNMAFMAMFISSISSSLFVLWLCLDSQSGMNKCGPGLYSILMLC